MPSFVSQNTVALQDWPQDYNKHMICFDSDMVLSHNVLIPK